MLVHAARWRSGKLGVRRPYLVNRRLKVQTSCNLIIYPLNNKNKCCLDLASPVRFVPLRARVQVFRPVIYPEND